MDDQDRKGIKIPAALDIERSVLGSMLIDPNTVNKGIETLHLGVFHLNSHRHIFQAILNLSKIKEGVDYLTVYEELQRMGKDEEAGGSSYLIELSQNIGSAANFEMHTRIILERSILRELISVCNSIINESYSSKEDALTILNNAERKIFEITERHLRKTFVELKTAVNEAMDYIDLIHSKNFLQYHAVPTGYYDLDDILGGFQKSDLVILAARPSMGKTAFALNIARNAAKYVPVGLFSLEMSLQQLVIRLLSAEAEIESHKIRTGKMPITQSQKLGMSAARLAEVPIYLDDSPAQTILEITAKSRRLKNEKNVGMIIIDYLQLMHSSERMESREREISHISRSLKSLAKELNIPVIALAQLNRAVESRTDKRPQPSDLRESGSLEQDADVVMFIHRPEQYGIKTDKDGNSLENQAEIIIAKHRNGPTGDVKLIFRKDFGKFESMLTQRQYAQITQSSQSTNYEDLPI